MTTAATPWLDRGPLHQFLEAAPDAIIVEDGHGLIVVVNPLTERMFGYRREALVGQPIELLVPGRARARLVGDEALAGSAPRTRPLGAGPSLSGRRSDGSAFPIELSLSPLETEDGTFVIGIVRDTTTKTRAEAKLLGLLDAAPDGILVVDRSGRIAIANAQIAHLFGYPREELPGQPVEVLVPERLRGTHAPQRESYFASPRTRPMGAGRELAGRRKDGTEFPVEISLSPLETEEGAFVISIVRDPSQRRRTEASFRALLESAPDGIIVIDVQGRIVIVNGQIERIFQYPREELLGQSIELLVPERFRCPHVGHRSGYFSDPRARPMGEGRELSGRRRDGTEVPVEISLSPVTTDRETLVVSIVRDTTQRRHAEAKFKGLLESAPDGIFVVDTSGRIVIVNTEGERLFGYDRTELLGQPIEILVPSRLKTSHVPLRDSYLASPNTRPMGAGRALTGRKKDGTEFPVEISLSPLDTERGLLVTSIVRDITDRREAEERLRVSLREKEVLLREIHHRVKNNLQVTSSLLKLQSGHIQDPQAREMFAESQGRIRSMALVHEKLYQSRDLSQIDFVDYVRSLAGLLRRSFGGISARIELQVEGDELFLSVDTAVPCGLIVNELLSNCMKHAFPDGRKGRIWVHVTKEDHRFVLSVRDDGVGLAAGLDPAHTETLGLQLVGTLAEQLRAELEIAGRDGTEFRIIVPESRPAEGGR
jgi:PAS domain S-box-containing protein